MMQLIHCNFNERNIYKSDDKFSELMVYSWLGDFDVRVNFKERMRNVYVAINRFVWDVIQTPARSNKPSCPQGQEVYVWKSFMSSFHVNLQVIYISYIYTQRIQTFSWLKKIVMNWYIFMLLYIFHFHVQ